MNGLQVAAGLALLCLIAVLFLPMAGRARASNVLHRAMRSPHWETITAVRRLLPYGWRIEDQGTHALFVYVALPDPRPWYRMMITADDGPCMVIVLDDTGRPILSESVENIGPEELVVRVIHDATHRDLPNEGTETP